MRKALASLALSLAFLAPVPNDADAFVLSPLAPGKWGSSTPGTPANITWSLMATGTSCNLILREPNGCTITSFADLLPSGFMTELNAAFIAWSTVANVTFTQVPDDGRPEGSLNASGDIRLGGHDLPDNQLAHSFYPPPHGGPFAGDVHLDTNTDWDIGPGGNGIDLFQVLVHEIGHSIGLAHSNEPNSLMNEYYTTAFRGPQADDIAGAQYLYGVRLAQVEAVPEASSMAVMATAILGVIAVHRRSRRERPALPAPRQETATA